jgi:predicted protein tyrosine phosphatase
MDPIFFHPRSGATLWVGGRHFSLAELDAAGMRLVVSAHHPGTDLTNWIAAGGKHQLLLFRDEPRLPPAAEEARIVALVVEALEAGENCLVHCKGGINRGPYLAARVMIACGLSPQRAIGTLRQRRSRVLSNRVFLAALGEDR